MSAIDVYKKKEEEKRLGSLYETLLKYDEGNQKFLIPDGMDKDEIKKYVDMMIRDAQPRHLRKEGRPSHNLDDYKIPMNYFVVESNSVNYNASAGSIYIDDLKEEEEEEEEQQKEEQKPTSFRKSIPRHFREYDYGTMICLYIFKNGRKTIDELVKEIKGIEIHLMTLLINKLKNDGYLRIFNGDYIENEDTGEKTYIETLELVSNKDEEPEQHMLSENSGGIEKTSS